MLELGMNIRFLVIYLSFQINQFIDRYSKEIVRDTTVKYVVELKSPLSEGVTRDQTLNIKVEGNIFDHQQRYVTPKLRRTVKTIETKI